MRAIELTSLHKRRVFVDIDSIAAVYNTAGDEVYPNRTWIMLTTGKELTVSESPESVIAKIEDVMCSE